VSIDAPLFDDIFYPYFSYSFDGFAQL